MRPPGSARGRTQSCGPTYGRCTSSTRTQARTCPCPPSPRRPARPLPDLAAQPLDQVGGREHAHDRPVLLGEPPARDLGPVQETVLVLHAPESPRLDVLAELGV